MSADPAEGAPAGPLPMSSLQLAPLQMASLPVGYRALVIGASGGIGAAFMAQLQADPRCASVQGLHRQSLPPIDYACEAGIAAAAATFQGGPPLNLLIVATGVLHGPGFKPEKRLADLNYGAMEAVFRANVFGPALLLRHFGPLLCKQRSLLAVLRKYA